MKFLDRTIEPLGMGCWPIGGSMYHGETFLGYANANDQEAIRTIHAALDHGIELFDTAAAYGAGHSERLLASALKGRPDPIIVTKIGIGIDETSKQLSFDPPRPEHVAPAIEACLKRLERDRIDVVLLHPNDVPELQAISIFDEMEKVRQAGKILAYGWSTDFSANAAAMAGRGGFKCVEHAMNLFFEAARMQKTLNEQALTALIRSPLAMGALSGKYDSKLVDERDVRSSSESWMEYFKGRKINPGYLETLDATRDLLRSGGRSLVQGALSWIWGKRQNNIPIPGARTVTQISEIAGAIEYGPFSDEIMTEIEALIDRTAEDEPDRPRQADMISAYGVLQ